VVTTLRAGWWLTRYALGEADLDAALDHAARVYTGLPVAEMEARVAAWFDREVRHRLRPGAADALARHRAAHTPLVLATTSSQFVARAAREAFGLDDAVMTQLGVDGDRLDGTIARSAFGPHKLRGCREWAAARGIALRDCAFYTDSASDLPLLEEVGHPVVIDPDRKLRRIAAARGWPTEDWGRAPKPR
jgi:phosphoserine phosphatase